MARPPLGLSIFTLAALVAAAVPARASARVDDDSVRVMLLDLKAAPRFEPVARPLGQIVAEEASRVRGYSLLSADEVRAALDQEANKALMGCSENSCLAELAQALDAALVIAGSIDEGISNDGTPAPIVSLTLLNTRAIVVVNRVTMQWRGDPALLPDVVRAAAKTLVLEPSQRPPGGLKVPPLPAGTQVFVDGVERTEDAKTGVLGGLDIGPREVRVQAPDKLPLTTFGIVRSHEVGPLDITLEDVPVPSVWLWLGGGAAVVVGGAAAIGIAYALGQSDVSVTATVPAFGANDVEAVTATGGKR